MCGIVGALTFDAFEKKSEERIRTEANIYITTQLLQATVERGKDATGVYLAWADGNYTGLKMGVPAPEFIARFGETEKDYKGLLKIWREYPKLMKIFIGHCRKSSIGNSYDNKNNHPIQIGNIILIHNGTLTNHDIIFDKLDCDRVGDVDSEAIGRLLHHYTNGGTDPFTTEMIKETTRRIHGTYSVLAMSGNNPYQVAQFRDGRPAEMAFVKPLKTVYIASEKKFLENIFFEFNKFGQLFPSSVKFPYLKAADVEFKTLQDDSLALWDLTVPITDKTEMGDLYDWEKTPLRVDKVWSTSTTTYQNNRNTAVGQKKAAGTEVNATSKTGSTSSGADEDADGLVWSRSMNKYKGQKGITETKTLGAVTIDVATGDINSADAAASKIVDIKEVGATAVENLISGAAEVQELSLKNVEKAADSVDAKKNSVTEKPLTVAPCEDAGSMIEVDMTSDPEAIKKAEEYIDKGLTKYENDEEVAGDLEASDPSVLRPLALYALANRIKKFIFKQGFVVGYKVRKGEETPAAGKTDKTDKLDNAEKKIRIMKIVVKVLAACLEQRTRGNSSSSVMELLGAVVKDTVKTANLDLGNAFSVGDLKKMPILKKLKENIENK